MRYGRSRQLNREGVCATLDVLGEDITTREEAITSRNRSNEVLHTIARENLDSNLSIKLTSLGLKLDKAFCVDNVREILKVAAGYGTFVRVDMEDSTCTTDTIDVFRTLHREYPNIGLVVQAYLYRTEGDVEALLLRENQLPSLQGHLQRERKKLPSSLERMSSRTTSSF